MRENNGWISCGNHRSFENLDIRDMPRITQLQRRIHTFICAYARLHQVLGTNPQQNRVGNISSNLESFCNSVQPSMQYNHISYCTVQHITMYQFHSTCAVQRPTARVQQTVDTSNQTWNKLVQRRALKS